MLQVKVTELQESVVGHAGCRVQRDSVHEFYLTQSVFQVLLQSSIPTQIFQLMVNISDSEG